MRAGIQALLIGVLLLPSAAGATDLTVSLEGIVEYDDNAFRNADDEEDDVFFRIRPTVKVHEDRGQDYRYHLRYAVPFEFAVENGDELDDIDHVVDGRVSYHPNDRLELYVQDVFRSLRGGERNIVVSEPAANEQLVNTERDRVILNDAAAGATYRFSPRVAGNLRVAHELFQSRRDDRADNYLLSGTGDLSFVLDPSHTLAAGVQVIYQDFDATNRILASQVLSYYVFGQWTWRYSETLQFQIAAGPSYIDSTQDDPPAQVTKPLVPSVTLGSGLTLDGSEGFLQSDGSAAVGTFGAGSVVVSQVQGCPILADGTTRVLTDDICPFEGSDPARAPIILDVDDNDFLGDDLLIAEVQSQTAVLDNANPVGKDSSSLDFFAEAVVSKRWTPEFASALRYSRTQGGASGLGGAVIRDAVNFSNNWQITERWELFVRADWTYRQSAISSGSTATFDSVTAAPNPLGGSAYDAGLEIAARDEVVTVRGDSTTIETMRWGVAGRLTHRFTRNTSTWVQLTYNQQESSGGTLGEPSDFDNFLGAVGVRHEFDPIKLW